jgi:alcohol dehydrogenase (cytochrome c)
MRALPMLATVAFLALAGVASGCSGGDNEAATEPTTTAATTTEPGSGRAASGSQLFGANCQSCHGQDGAGGHIGPNLQESPVAENLDQVLRQIRNGGGAMPPFAGVLSDEEIDLIAKYVVERIAPKA